MTALPAFRLLRPATVAEALDMRRANPDARFLAGGTDLIVNMRHGLAAPEALIDLGGIETLGRIQADDGGLCIGAGVTLARLIEDAAVSAGFPVLAAAARTVAGSTHRETATVGGNLCLDTRCLYYNQSEWWRRANGYCLKSGGGTCHVAPTGDRCHGAFSGDLAPALLVMGAEVGIAAPDGTRTIPLGELYADDGAAHLRLEEGALVTSVRVPSAAGLRADYAKARVRGSVDFPLAGVAVALARDGDGLQSLHVAVTGTDPRPLLVPGTESFVGAPLDDGAIERLEKMVRKQIQPMRGTLSAGHYRRRVAASLAGRLARRLYHR